MSPHLCAAPGCSAELPPELMFCTDHWLALPRTIRRRVNRAYSRFAEKPKDHLRLQEMMAARAAALEALGVAA